MVSAHAYPTFELSDAVLLLAKTAARERKLGPCPEIPYCPEIPSLTLLPRWRQFNSPQGTVVASSGFERLPSKWFRLPVLRRLVHSARVVDRTDSLLNGNKSVDRSNCSDSRFTLKNATSAGTLQNLDSAQEKRSYLAKEIFTYFKKISWLTEAGKCFLVSRNYCTSKQKLF